MRYYFLILWIIGASGITHAQQDTAEARTDSVLYELTVTEARPVTPDPTVKADTTHPHSVAKATWLSTAFPGLGQIYNRKYWKLPIIYAALGTTIYFVIDNHQSYRFFLDGFYEIQATPADDRFLGIYDERQLVELQNIYRKWRDLNIILTGLGYALNILDAHVDAHLYYYNIDEDLTLRWEPALIRAPGMQAIGLSLKLDIQ